MRKTVKTTLAILTAMTMTAGAMGVTAYANDTVVEQSLSDGNTELGLVLNTKGTEMKQYLLDNGINETTADSTIKLYLEGLKSRIERGIANADGSENNEKTAKYYKTMCMNVAKTEMYLADEKAEYSDNDAAEYFSENDIEGDENTKMTELFLDGCKNILVSIESLPDDVNVTVDPTISYTNKIGDSSDLNALQEELAQYDKTLDVDTYNDGKIVIQNLVPDETDNNTETSAEVSEYNDVLLAKGEEMKQYLMENGIDEKSADSTLVYYLEGLKKRIEKGIADSEGNERNEKTAKYYRTMSMNVAKTEMYLADEKAEYSDNEAAEYFSENGIDGDDNLKMTTLFLDGCKKILMSIESLPENVNVTVDPTISYTNKIGDSSDLNALQEELAQYDKTLDADAYNDGKIVILDLTTDTSNNATLKGDADVNGEVGLSDVVAVSKHNINSTAYPLANEIAEANADMNNDNVVDGLDTSALVEYNLGKK